jgi:hypothetical protein
MIFSDGEFEALIHVTEVLCLVLAGLYVVDCVVSKWRMLKLVEQTQAQMTKIIRWNFDGVEGLTFPKASFWRSKYQIFQLAGSYFNPTWYYECVINGREEFRVAAPVYDDGSINYGLAKGDDYRTTTEAVQSLLKVRDMKPLRLLTLREIRELEYAGFDEQIDALTIARYFEARGYH